MSAKVRAMKTLTVLGRKGGIGKTTTALALAYGLEQRGKKVLAIDTDSQASLTECTLTTAPRFTLYDVLTELDLDPRQALIPISPGIDLLPSDPMEDESLARLNRIELEDSPSSFRNLINTLSGGYDYCIIDTPPDLGFFTQSAMTASDSLVIPIMADRFSVSGLKRIKRAYEQIKESYNPGLQIAGLLITQYQRIGNLNKAVSEIIQKTAEDENIYLFSQPIRATLKQREAMLARQSIFRYCPRHPITEDYNAFINELLEREE